MSGKILIAYFSRSGNNYVGGSIVDLPIGNTEIAAKIIEKLTVGKLFKIDPIHKFSEDYSTCTLEAREQLEKNERPELAEYLDSVDEYDTIILGYPSYCGTMPMPVWTFLEHYDFSGKIILPLCTHEGSGMGVSKEDIIKLCPNAKLFSGLAVRGGDAANAQPEIEGWLKENSVI